MTSWMWLSVLRLDGGVDGGLLVGWMPPLGVQRRWLFLHPAALCLGDMPPGLGEKVANQPSTVTAQGHVRSHQDQVLWSHLRLLGSPVK